MSKGWIRDRRGIDRSRSARCLRSILAAHTDDAGGRDPSIHRETVQRSRSWRRSRPRGTSRVQRSHVLSHRRLPSGLLAFFTSQRFTVEDSERRAAVRAAAHARGDRALAQLDGLIGDSGHVYRAKRTVADAYAFVMARWSENFPKTRRDYGNLAPFMQKWRQIPPFRR
jgi:glutathione S-transferase